MKIIGPSGPVRIDACDAPSHLLLTMEPGTEDETQVEARITAEGSRARPRCTGGLRKASGRRPRGRSE